MSGKAPFPPEPVSAAFDVFVLGTRSSGKSVLLASLYRQLSSMDGITNFFARCDDPEQHRELCDNYDQLLDTEADWPAGTYRVDSYDMGCFHRLRGKSLPVFSIRFHDYPGGYVSDQVERREFIEERAEQCNSVMALIDGRKLLDRLEDREANPAHSLHKDLDSLVRVLQQCIGKPIHFVLTKADLLDPAKYPLKTIVAEFKRHKGLRDILVQQIDAGASCYLVPVSAIGPKFAFLDPADGLIKKRRNGTIEPFHLEVMTSLSMVDTVLDLVRTAPPAYEPDPGVRPLLVRLKEKIGNKLGYARMAAPVTYPIFGPLAVVAIVATTMLSERYIANKSRSFEDKVREIRQSITDRTSALEAILNIQYQLLDRFLKRFPQARLGARFDIATAFAPRVAKVAEPVAREVVPLDPEPEKRSEPEPEKAEPVQPVVAEAEPADPSTGPRPEPTPDAELDVASDTLPMTAPFVQQQDEPVEMEPVIRAAREKTHVSTAEEPVAVECDAGATEVPEPKLQPEAVPAQNDNRPTHRRLWATAAAALVGVLGLAYVVGRPSSSPLPTTDAAYAAHVGSVAGTKRSKSGLLTREARAGEGKSPIIQDFVLVRLALASADGSTVWYDGNDATIQQLATLTPGVREAIMQMKPGGISSVWIPAGLANTKSLPKPVRSRPATNPDNSAVTMLEGSVELIQVGSKAQLNAARTKVEPKAESEKQDVAQTPPAKSQPAIDSFTKPTQPAKVCREECSTVPGSATQSERVAAVSAGTFNYPRGTAVPQDRARSLASQACDRGGGTMASYNASIDGRCGGNVCFARVTATCRYRESVPAPSQRVCHTVCN